MSVKSRILLLISILFTAECFAGGYYFPVEVTEFKKDSSDGLSYSVILSPVSEKRSWDEEKCKTLRISGSYDSLRWKSYKRPMNKDGHIESMQYLEKSIGKVIFFGVMGSGLKKVSECSFLSKGLFIEGAGESIRVLSVHRRI